ncbi:hypothetical protein KUTeg_006905 [Tegillarca granosa]|uniref:Uncharacterized protein n=1 Tax=Tegillarca granosa TaxID=220873 RepID=A0ABQ9FEP9_TEGGR|nr:hypothetical protein KUTeg_006905 [Tegillarca granosa]
MICRVVLISTIIALCVGRQYAEKQYGHTCSGQPLAKLGPGAFKQDITKLAGRWYNKFLKTNIVQEGKPTNVFIDFKVKRGSVKAEEILNGNNPVNGECLVWSFRDFQIYEGIACYAEKGVNPETCVDEEWIHYVSKVPRSTHKLLFFYYCADADANPKRKCSKFFARCLFDTPYINKYDISACRKLFHDFGLGELPAEDTGSGNNVRVIFSGCKFFLIVASNIKNEIVLTQPLLSFLIFTLINEYFIIYEFRTNMATKTKCYCQKRQKLFFEKQMKNHDNKSSLVEDLHPSKIEYISLFQTSSPKYAAILYLILLNYLLKIYLNNLEAIAIVSFVTLLFDYKCKNHIFYHNLLHWLLNLMLSELPATEFNIANEDIHLFLFIDDLQP